MRRFGSNRSHGHRKRAGVDLYAKVGTPIRAMADGTVLHVGGFYGGTYAIEVDHGTFIARYGEVGSTSTLVNTGDEVKRG